MNESNFTSQCSASFILIVVSYQKNQKRKASDDIRPFLFIICPIFGKIKNMNNMPYPVTVFYDGKCRMCVAQIGKFQKADLKKHLIFVDASKPDFNQEQAGLAGG